MTRRLLLSYLTLTVFVLLILEIPLGITLARHERRVLTAEVERDAFVLAASSEDVLEGTGTTDLALLVNAYAAATGARAIVVDAHGVALADSDPLDPAGRNFATRPEIRAALAGEVSSGVRRSDTLRQDLLYVAVPASSGGKVHGAVRITFPMTDVQARVARGWWTLALVALVVLGSASGVGWRLATSVARPLRSLEDVAERLAGGDLAARAPGSDGPEEVRSLGRTINDMAARLEELVGAQRAFVADASHQLRTPLTALRLRLENIEDGATPAIAEEAEAAAREAWRLERIVEGLLALARAEGARAPRQTTDVGAIVAERIAMWAPLAAERDVLLAAEVTGTPCALASAGALEQILDNLLANALEVAPAGSTITVRAHGAHGSIEIHVLDEGPGMPEEARVRAFDRFWRGDGTGTGSGLGLAIVRQLARASGGDASLDLAPGGGLDAWVRLEATAGPASP